MSKGENIVRCIKEQRISWLGHLGRMEGDKMPKKDIHPRTGWNETRGRARKGWKQEVEGEVVQVLEVKRWRELVTDRKKNGRR
jgi:hypothetical protein